VKTIFDFDHSDRNHVLLLIGRDAYSSARGFLLAGKWWSRLRTTPNVSVETHGIDFVPLAERYGTPLRLFTLWFSVNLTILGVALGTLGVAAGPSLASCSRSAWCRAMS
jgi:hypothetical protein